MDNAPEFDPQNYEGGWHYDPIAVAEIAALQPISSFGDTPAGMDESPLPDHVYLWDAARKVLGGLLPGRSQGTVGSCVAFGTTRAIEYTLLWEIANGSREAYFPTVEETLYGLSRYEIGKGRLGRGDGSIGAWAAQAANLYGVIRRGTYGKWDLSKYSESQCRQFGATGCPDDLEPTAKMHPVKGITQVTTWEQAKRALANGNGIAISSSQGFTMSRDKDGFATARGVWRHCMCLCGYQTKREGGRIDNSWGMDSHSGPTGEGAPGTEGFWADAKVLDSMLRQGDSWAFSAVEGFPVTKRRWIL